MNTLHTLIKAGALLAIIAGFGLSSAIAADNAKACKSCCKTSCSSCAKCADCCKASCCK